MLILIATLLPGVAYSQSCNSLVANQVNWLKQDPHNAVTAVVATNAALVGVVSYTEIPMTWSPWASNWLFSSAPGTQWYSNETWGSSYYPFSPFHTKTMTLSISPTGGVTVRPDGGESSYSFNATCMGLGVMSGQVNGFLSTRGYMITFRKSVIPPTVN
jgi:hypothetical protein